MTDSPWDGVDEDRLVARRVEELKRIHDLREAVAETVALKECGYTFSGIAAKMDLPHQYYDEL